MKTVDQVFADIRSAGELQRVRSAQRFVLDEMLSILQFAQCHPVLNADLEAMAAYIAKTDRGISADLLQQAWDATR